MHPTILPPALGKIVGQTWLFSLAMATGLGQGKLNSHLLFSTQKIDLVLHPACVEGLVNTYMWIKLDLVLNLSSKETDKYPQAVLIHYINQMVWKPSKDYVYHQLGNLVNVELVWFGIVLWYINYCRLFNTKSFLNIYIKYMISKHIL